MFRSFLRIRVGVDPVASKGRNENWRIRGLLLPSDATMIGIFESFTPYVRTLRELATRCVTTDGYKGWNQQAELALDGEPSEELRSRVSLEVRRASGTFFTGSVLAKLALQEIDATEVQQAIFSDPTCGAGDLLIAAARRLPLNKTLHGTLRNWSKRLSGGDMQPQFISAAKTRLLLLARQRLRLKKVSIPRATQSFSQLKTGDALKSSARLKKATVILLNPPFSPTIAPNGCRWASGTVNSAAVFLLSVLKRVRPGTKLIAILPEVLRTGSRYQYWRDEISKVVRIEKIRRYGVFDSSADVDVFIGVFVKRKYEDEEHTSLGWRRKARVRSTVSQHFEVAVGPVVPFRHPHAGPWRSYLHPRNAPGWKTIKKIMEKRRFKQPLFKPPFVVIRRTSRPGDKHRAIGSIVVGKRFVAVENHLIICKPRTGGLLTCQRLLKALKSDATTKFFDERIRCRHLTVQSVKELPYRSEGRRTSSKW